MLIDYDVLLFPVFQEMRRLGTELSISDYLLAIKVLRSGIGLENAIILEQTCRLLWAKSHEEQEIFDVAFSEKAAPLLKIVMDMALPENDASQAQLVQPHFPDEDERAPSAQQEKREYEEKKGKTTKTIHLLALPESEPAFPSSSFRKTFYFTPRLSVSRREMAGYWRQLRQMQAMGLFEELDIEKTINDICHWGVFRKPAMRSRYVNATQLVLLIDQGGSMVPFKLLIEAFIESAKHGLPDKIIPYYFHDYPGSMLYKDARLGQPVPLKLVFNRFVKNNSILIVSDAGAARAHYDNHRIDKTKAFLQHLRSYTYLYAWLNPMPRYRWRFTTAEDIAQLIPMYPLDSNGLNDATTILRGYPFPPGARVYV